MRRINNLAVLMLLLIVTVSEAGSRQTQTKGAADDAYRAFSDERDFAIKADLGEKFLADNPGSTLAPQAYRMLIETYLKAEAWMKVTESADRVAVLPAADAGLKIFADGSAMVAARHMDNFAKVIDYGESVLSIDPGNLIAMLTLATILPEKLPQDALGKTAVLDKAERLANRALARVQEVFSQPPPTGISDAQWERSQAEYNGQLHSALGLIHLNRRNWVSAAEQYEIALTNVPSDGIAHFRLGLAYQSQNRRADAIREYQTVISLGGVVAGPAQQMLDRNLAGTPRPPQMIAVCDFKADAPGQTCLVR